MKEITLNQPNEVLKVNIGEKAYSIPLAGSMPFMDAMKLRKGTPEEKVDLLIAYLQRYIPEKVFATLSSDAVTQIIKAWNEASKEAQGATPGES